MRVLIADDEALFRSGLRLIMESEPGLDVVGEAADGLQAVDAVSSLGPDVVLMDVQMPRLDGIAATRRVVDARPATKVVMLTTFGLDRNVYDAFRAGASGFLLKTVPPEDLIGGLRVAARGDALVAPDITRRLVEDWTRRPPPDMTDVRLTALTDREREVLRLVGRGLSNHEISRCLHVAEATIKTHVGRLLLKTNSRDRVQAVVLAYETGLVVPGHSSTQSGRART
jgi:DNA-binding NarL/FixJ family response regulator